MLKSLADPGRQTGRPATSGAQAGTVRPTGNAAGSVAVATRHVIQRLERKQREANPRKPTSDSPWRLEPGPLVLEPG